MNRLLTWVCLLAAASASQAQNVCRLDSGGGLAFGPYDAQSAAPTDSLMNVTVTCDRNGGPQHITVIMSLGAGSNGTSASTRRMAHTGGAGDYLSYGLFRDVTRSSNWGFSPGVDTVSQMLSVSNRDSASTTFTVYGRIPPRQNVRAGSYSDTLQVSITP